MVINEYYRSGWFITGLSGFIMVLHVWVVINGYYRSGWLLMSITGLGGYEWVLQVWVVY